MTRLIIRIRNKVVNIRKQFLKCRTMLVFVCNNSEQVVDICRKYIVTTRKKS